MLKFHSGRQWFTIPISWAEVTTIQYMNMMLSQRIKNGDAIEALSIFTGLEYRFIMDLSVGELTQLLEAIQWASEAPEFDKLPCPAELTIKDRKCLIPKNIRLKEYGQKVIFHEALKGCMAEERDTATMLDEAIAVYLYPQFSGKVFDAEDLDEIKEAVKVMPIMKTYPVAAFFLSSYLKSSSLKTKGLNMFPNQKRFQQALRISRASA